MMNDLPADQAAGAGTPASAADSLALRLRQIRFEGTGIHSFEFVDPAGAQLPEFAAGAHLDVHLPGGVIRQYSISSDPADRHRYVIAVLRDEQGRGGSKAVHETLKVGDVIRTSLPRNHFRIASGVRKAVLLAGGIGVTPLKAMAHELQRAGIPFELHYCAKDASFAAFDEEFRALCEPGQVHWHFDGGDPSKGLDLAKLLAEPAPGTQVYYCGPAGFMKACAAATRHWPHGSVHFEHFKPPVEEKPAGTAVVPEGAFTIRIHSTGAKVPVNPDESIVQALGRAGIHVETSCESGLCGTCKVPYLSGTVDHRDYILSDEEHATCLTACVSRCTSPELELDL